MGTPCGFKSHLPQLREQKCSLFFARKQAAMHGQDENRTLKACFQASWSQIGRIRRMPRQSQAAKRRRDLSAWRIALFHCRHGELPHIILQMLKKAAAYATALLRGTDGARTHDLPHVKRTLIPAELRFHIKVPPKRTVEPTGLEPVTSRV